LNVWNKVVKLSFWSPSVQCTVRFTVRYVQVELLSVFLETTGGTKIVEGLNYRAYKGLRILFEALPYRMLRMFKKWSKGSLK